MKLHYITLNYITSTVTPEYAVCGRNITIPPDTVIPASDIPCHQIQSFYTWHPLRGINLDILMLFIDGLLYFLFIGNKTFYMVMGLINSSSGRGDQSVLHLSGVRKGAHSWLLQIQGGGRYPGR